MVSQTQKINRDPWISLCLIAVGVACISGSQNIMSPNLTSIAEEFSFNQDERDRLLGAKLFLAYSVFSIPVAAPFGLLADCCSRKKLFVCTVVLGEIATLLTAYVESYSSLFFLRILSGTAANAVIPIAFSFLADLYPPDQRSLASTVVTGAMGFGILIGQIISGIIGPRSGWRFPFILVALPGLASSILTTLYIHEPVRGASEEALGDLIRSGGEYRKKLDVETFIQMLRIPTNLILIIQALPGTIPWGVLFAYLNDFLSQEKGLSVEQATLIVTMFGIGSAIGGIGGGIAGQYVYKKSIIFLPILMGVSTILGAFPLFALINANMKDGYGYAIPYTVLGGILANINGANVRPLLLNVNLPETRGAVVSVANLVANLGRGIGPSIANSLMQGQAGRQGAFNFSLSLWFFCGAMEFFMCFTLLRDVTQTQEKLRKTAQGLRKERFSGLNMKKMTGVKDTSKNDQEAVLLMPDEHVHEETPLHFRTHHNAESQRKQDRLEDEHHTRELV